MDLERAEILAEQVVIWLEPACERIAVAGSVRRRKPEVHDVELVLISHRDPGLFGTGGESHVERLLPRLIREGKLAFDTRVKRNGPRLKRLVLPDWGLVVELYIADRDNFGNLLTIRTGDAEFSHRLVTNRHLGGCMPYGMRQADGYLWRKVGGEDQHYPDGYEKVPCPDEESFFGALGIDRVPRPELRNAETARRLARGMAGVSG